MTILVTGDKVDCAAEPCADTSKLTAAEFNELVDAVNAKGNATSEFAAGEEILVGDVCYIGAEGKMLLATAATVDTSKRLLFMAMEDCDADQLGFFTLFGNVPVGDHGFDVGVKLYLSAVNPGGVTIAVPDTGFVERLVGFAVDAETIYFNPYAAGDNVTEINNYFTEEVLNEITYITNYLTEETINEITEVTNHYTEINQTTGFVNHDDSVKTFDNETRTFTIAPAEGVDSFAFYAFGTRYEKTEAESIQIDNINGYWYIYYSGAGVLGASQDIWDLSTQVPICSLLWDGGAGEVIEEPTGPPGQNKLLPLYLMAVSIPSTLTASQVVLFHVISGSEKVEIARNAPYSTIKCGVAPTAQVVFDIIINGTERGTATINAGQMTGFLTWNQKITMNPLSTVKIVAPAEADSTLAQVGITLQGVRK
jgi:hypothetical protein